MPPMKDTSQGSKGSLVQPRAVVPRSASTHASGRKLAVLGENRKADAVQLVPPPRPATVPDDAAAAGVAVDTLAGAQQGRPDGSASAASGCAVPAAASLTKGWASVAVQGTAMERAVANTKAASAAAAAAAATAPPPTGAAAEKPSSGRSLSSLAANQPAGMRWKPRGAAQQQQSFTLRTSEFPSLAADKAAEPVAPVESAAGSKDPPQRQPSAAVREARRAAQQAKERQSTGTDWADLMDDDEEFDMDAAIESLPEELQSALKRSPGDEEEVAQPLNMLLVEREQQHGHRGPAGPPGAGSILGDPRRRGPAAPARGGMMPSRSTPDLRPAPALRTGSSGGSWRRGDAPGPVAASAAPSAPVAPAAEASAPVSTPAAWRNLAVTMAPGGPVNKSQHPLDLGLDESPGGPGRSAAAPPPLRKVDAAKQKEEMRKLAERKMAERRKEEEQREAARMEAARKKLEELDRRAAERKAKQEAERKAKAEAERERREAEARRVAEERRARELAAEERRRKAEEEEAAAREAEAKRTAAYRPPAARGASSPAAPHARGAVSPATPSIRSAGSAAGPPATPQPPQPSKADVSSNWRSEARPVSGRASNRSRMSPAGPVVRRSGSTPTVLQRQGSQTSQLPMQRQASQTSQSSMQRQASQASQSPMQQSASSEPVLATEGSPQPKQQVQQAQQQEQEQAKASASLAFGSSRSEIWDKVEPTNKPSNSAIWDAAEAGTARRWDPKSSVLVSSRSSAKPGNGMSGKAHGGRRGRGGRGSRHRVSQGTASPAPKSAS